MKRVFEVLYRFVPVSLHNEALKYFYLIAQDDNILDIVADLSSIGEQQLQYLLDECCFFSKIRPCLLGLLQGKHISNLKDNGLYEGQFHRF